MNDTRKAIDQLQQSQARMQKELNSLKKGYDTKSTARPSTPRTASASTPRPSASRTTSTSTPFSKTSAPQKPAATSSKPPTPSPSTAKKAPPKVDMTLEMARRASVAADQRRRVQSLIARKRASGHY
ncbi:hypothetical protein F5Y15DRAFT_413333 [Xylariaceae sp. FL0016]|nr:hypothetical protein F5Y15DRAFT_413333 [Xylariaceae sp. FL0016]